MQLSYNGLERLKDEEGFRDTAYKDVGGVWTIGYGTISINGISVEQGMKCSEPEALQWLAQDTARVQTAINQLVRIPLKQNMFDALVSFTYNEGIGAFTTSTMLRLLNLGDVAGAAKQFDRWVYDFSASKEPIAGLVARRRREQSLFEQ